MNVKSKNLFKKFTAVYFVVFLITGFLNFGFVPSAQAACNYRIEEMYAQSNVDRNGILLINTKVSRAGTSGECSNQVTLIFLAKDGGVSGSELTRKTLNFNNSNEASLQVDYLLSNFNWSSIPNQNSLQLFMRVRDTAVVAESAVWNVNVVGSTGSIPSVGAKRVTVRFDKSLYNKDDRASIYFKLENPNPTADKDVEIVTKINSKIVGSFSQTGRNLGAEQYQYALISTSNSVVNGANAVKVQFFEQGTNKQVLFAEGDAVFQAQGLGVTSSANNPTKLPNNANCSANNDCQSNFCNNAGSCVACTTNADCDTGLSCNAGVCVGGSSGANPPAAGTDVLYNPLPSDSLTGTLLFIAKGFLGVIAIWSAVFIIIGGFQMVMSAGNEESLLKAKKTVMWAVLGLAVALLSFSIVAIVQNLFQVTVKDVKSGMVESKNFEI